MKKFLIIGLLLLSFSLVQAAEIEGPRVIEQPQYAQPAARYGLQLRPFVFGADFRDNYPHSSTTKQVVGGFGWASEVGGWFEFNPAITLGLIPPQNLMVQGLSSSTIRLDWQNIGQYDDLLLTYSLPDEPYNFVGRQGRRIPPNQDRTFPQTYTVQNLEANSDYGFYLTSRQELPDEVVTEYTPTVQGRTGRDEGRPEAEEFGLTCSAIDKNTISLIWAGPSLVPEQSLALYYAFQEQNFEQNSRRLASGLTNTGSRNHQGLEPDATVYYRLKLVEDGETTWIPSIADPAEPAISCTTLGEISQDPSHLAVTTLSRTSLYITWRDNAVRPHNFQIERIKITPLASNVTNLEALSPNQIKIHWTNPTNGEQFKSPFYHVIERATNPDFNNAVSQQVSFSDDQNYNGRQTAYERTDSNLAEGTIYYYRLKACSFIQVTLEGRNQEICSPVSEVSSVNMPLFSPTNLTAVQSGNRVTLSWRDNSQAEEGYQMVRVNQSNGERRTFILGVNAESTTDYPETGGTYTYEIRAFRDEVGGRIYSEPAVVEINFESEAGLPKPSLAASLWHSVRSFFKLTTYDVVNMVASLGHRMSEIWGRRAVAQENYDLENYWPQSRRQLDINNYPSVFTDTDLTPDTVFLYRVKGIYTDEGLLRETRYTPVVAGKTFAAGEGVPASVKVCLRNQLCGAVQGEIVGQQRPANQCSVNADCANVGTYRRVIKETKGR